MRTIAKAGVLSISGLLCVTPILPLQGQTTIYDNSVGDLTTRYNPGTVEIGDNVDLDGVERNLTFFSFEYWGTNSAAPNNSAFAGNVEARVKLYLMDGDLDPNNHVRPATELFNSGWFGSDDVPNFGPTPRSTLFFTAGIDWAAAGLHIPANTITWSVQFRGMEETDSVGVDIYCPPVTGGNPNSYWENRGTESAPDWILLWNSDAPNYQMNFGALMLAVPEPSVMALSLIGGLCVLLLSRRLRHKE
ncbi:MAG TPA: hypothetical protein P5205_16525 [Candidatus Paceibacterota bacterium]|nr:hypothetical protein [Verrucomicrobiota bacterium]HSA11968.1 hypothetical protein [Candidatus Paceibacterota bacterium]